MRNFEHVLSNNPGNKLGTPTKLKKCYTSVRLLLQEQKIDFNAPQDDDLDDSNNEEFIPDPMDDLEDQYDSADEAFYDDKEEIPDYDDSQPYATPNFFLTTACQP
jgi:hypothetical protein